METMDMTREIVRDTRLSSDARIVALEVHLRKGDQHEISFDEWSMLLGQAGNHRIRRALKQAELSGWIDRTPGGGGHSDSFTSSLPESTTLSDKVEKSTTLDDEKDGESYQPNSDSLPESTTLGGTVGGREIEGEIEGEEESSARDLSDRASRAIDQHEDLLQGCRGSLRDYLTARVPKPLRQYAYVQKIAGWLEGTDPSVWRKPNGRTVPPDERTPMLADALNDLAASDESQMKRPSGDPANLRTKLSVLIAQRYRSDQESSSGQSSTSDGEPFVPAQLGG